VSRRTLVIGFALCALLAAPAHADVIVNMTGTDSGATPGDTLIVGGDGAQNTVAIREGFEGDVDASGQPDECGGNDRLCFLTVEANVRIDARNACQQVGANDRMARCAYFFTGSSVSTHRYNARISLGGGNNDRVVILQDAVSSGSVGVTVPWNWEIDYGPGDDVANGPEVLSVPDQRGTLSLDILGGTGADTFNGTFAGRVVRIFGDNDDASPTGDGNDVFASVSSPTGMSMTGESGNDVFRPASGPSAIDAGPGADSLNLEDAIDTPSDEYVGGAGVDSVRWGLDAPALRVFLDGSQPSTGGDTLRGWENATGGRNGDRITGTDDANVLVGNGGAGDNLIGGAGDDRLDVDDGNAAVPGVTSDDAVDGGAGVDTIFANDGNRDLVSCGSSSHPVTVFINNQSQQLTVFDSDIARLDLADVERDCEDVEREPVKTPPSARVVDAKAAGRGSLRVVLACGKGVGGRCKGTVSAGGAAERYRIRKRKRDTVAVGLAKRERRRLANRGFAVVRIETAEVAADGRDRTRHRALLVKRSGSAPR
jgi:Ca2+-binding RTX toxin-like protein